LKGLVLAHSVLIACHKEGNMLGWEDMKNKLALVRKIIDEVWPGEA
jgi:hypothetical protein